jgi:hypothetical protein
MAVRTTVDIPEPLHHELKRRAAIAGTSIRSLIVAALEQTYTPSKKKGFLTGPLIPASGKRGPRYPVDENPHELIFS